MESVAQSAKQTSWILQTTSPESKNAALLEIQSQLLEDKQEILRANKIDVSNSTQPNLTARLELSSFKFETLLSGISNVISLEDPTNKCTLARKLADNLELYRITSPLGVILVIFEARPEVLVQITSLAIKSGNAVILKGGSESSNTNLAIFKSIQKALSRTDIPTDAVSLVFRNDITDLLKLDAYIDLVIPRGSKQLVTFVKQNTSIPVLGHSDGLCSIFIDEEIDLDVAISVIIDSKTDYPAACNSCEKLLVHEKLDGDSFDKIVKALIDCGVVLYMDSESRSRITIKSDFIRDIEPDSSTTEYLDLKITILTIKTLTDAISHINQFGSHHTDCIITKSNENREEFMNKVDSAGVFSNASTRFADGFRYGFGAEIGVSTNKTHARGPCGLESLVIYRYRVYGNGQAAAWFGDGKLGKGIKYKHEDLVEHRFK